MTEKEPGLGAATSDPMADTASGLARRIHDEPIQSLTAAGLWLLVARKRSNDPDQLELLDKAQDALAGSIRSLRQIMSELVPEAAGQIETPRNEGSRGGP